MAATRRNVNNMHKSRKLQSRKGRAFVADPKLFDGSHVSAEKRSPKKSNYTLARKLIDNYCLHD